MKTILLAVLALGMSGCISIQCPQPPDHHRVESEVSEEQGTADVMTCDVYERSVAKLKP